MFGSAVPFAEPLWYSRGLDLHHGESHQRLRHEVRTYVDDHISPFCSAWEGNGEVPTEVLKRHAELGFTAALINPSKISEFIQDIRLPGGISVTEWDSFHDLICIDEIARCGSLGVLWALGCGNAIGCPPIINFGTKSQKERFLPGVLRGETRFCLAVTEPGAGSDVANISTQAILRGDNFIVNGTKQWVTNGMWADYCTAAVRTGAAGKGGISVLLIPLNAVGVVRREIPVSGVASSGCAALEFHDVEVSVANLLGKVDEGFKLIMANFNHERLWIAANCLRLARVCLDDAFCYATDRKTFGKALIERQCIRHKLSNMGMKITSAYALLESLVDLSDRFSKRSESDAVMDGCATLGGLCAMAKVLSAQAFEYAVRESQQILGGLGYTRTGRGARIELLSRDFRVLVIGGGSEEIMSELAISQELKDIQYLKA